MRLLERLASLAVLGQFKVFVHAAEFVVVRLVDALAKEEPEFGRHGRRHEFVREQCKFLVVLGQLTSNDGEHGADELANLVQHERLPDDLAPNELLALHLKRRRAFEAYDVALRLRVRWFHLNRIVMKIMRPAVIF